MLWTLMCFGFWVGVAFALTGGIVDNYIGRICETHCPEKLAVNQPPTVSAHLTDILAANFERPWWEGGPAPR